MSLRSISVPVLSVSAVKPDIQRHRGPFLFSSPPSSSYSSASNHAFLSIAHQEFRRRRSERLVVSASNEIFETPLTGVLFQPFEELKNDALVVPVARHVSLARQRYTEECEAAINQQINVEYNVSYVYHAMFAYFDRDNIALKGLAKFFKESSEEEREHAEKLMKYQNKRGGKVIMQSILLPPSEFDHEEKGDALFAMELALSLEKLTNEKLLSLHSVAERNNDPQLADFVETEFLTEQANLEFFLFFFTVPMLKPLRRLQNMFPN